MGEYKFLEIRLSLIRKTGIRNLNSTTFIPAFFYSIYLIGMRATIIQDGIQQFLEKPVLDLALFLTTYTPDFIPYLILIVFYTLTRFLFITHCKLIQDELEIYSKKRMKTADIREYMKDLRKEAISLNFSRFLTLIKK